MVRCPSSRRRGSSRTLPLRSAGRHCSRHGLTLLEVLLAAGLGIVLIGGIYAAIEQTWRMNASGKVELERQQIARAVLRQITLDIRNTGFTAKPSGETDTSGTSSSGTAGTGGTSGSGSSSGSTTGSGGASASGSSSGSTGSTETTTVAGEDKPQWTTSEGIRGTTTELSIDLSNPRMLSSAMSVNGTRPTDLQTVVYAVSSTNGATFANGADSGTFNRPDTDGLGLVRSAGDRSALEEVGESTSAMGLPGPAKLLAPEIAGIQFRYFNGLAWMTEWDTVALGMLPRAVEVTIVFEPPPSRGLMTNATVAPGSEIYRTVIPVPASDPIVAEEAF